MSISPVKPLGEYQYVVVSQPFDDWHPRQGTRMAVFEISYRGPRTPTGDNVIAQFGVCEDGTEL